MRNPFTRKRREREAMAELERLVELVGPENIERMRSYVASLGVSGEELADALKRNAQLAANATEGPGWDGPDDWQEVRPRG